MAAASVKAVSRNLPRLPGRGSSALAADYLGDMTLFQEQESNQATIMLASE